jgi:hypothetical protein
MTMRISSNAKELAELKYVERAQQISGKHYRNIKRYEQTMPRGGAMKGAIDNEHLAMAREIAETYADTYLESFVAERRLPDANDLREIKSEIENIVGRHRGNEFWTPRPSTAEALIWLPQQVYSRFAKRVRQLELESQLQEPVQQAASSNRINIHGDNYGSIQQGGQGNVQNVTEDKENETK